MEVINCDDANSGFPLIIYNNIKSQLLEAHFED